MFLFKKKTSKHAKIPQKEIARQADELYRLGVTAYREFDLSWKEYLTKSASLKSTRAMRYLGKIYQQRLEYKEAAYWYEKAYENGADDIATELGKLYLKCWDGSGNSENPQKAEELFNIAIENGDEHARELLENLKEKYENPSAISKDQAIAVEDFAISVIRKGVPRYQTSPDDKRLVDTIISWLQDPMQINFTYPNKTAAFLNFRLMREDMGASYFEYMLQLKYNPAYELLLSATLLFDSQPDTTQILSRLKNVSSYFSDLPEKALEFPDIKEIADNLYEYVRINERRLEDELLYEKSLTKTNEILQDIYAKLEAIYTYKAL